MKKRKKRKTHTLQKNVLLIVLVLAISSYFVWTKTSHTFIEYRERTKLEHNYGEKIELYASMYGISAAYLKALVQLECGGRKNFPQRYEAHIYNRLKEVKQGTRNQYEHVRTRTLKDASDEALKNLASSWGPFQIMGYKCIELGITVADLRGDDAIYWGVQWIKKTYGKELDKENYKNAFHLHNTGKKFPKNGKSLTYDPTYVERGIQYMNYYKEKTHTQHK